MLEQQEMPIISIHTYNYVAIPNAANVFLQSRERTRQIVKLKIETDREV